MLFLSASEKECKAIAVSLSLIILLLINLFYKRKGRHAAKWTVRNKQRVTETESVQKNDHFCVHGYLEIKAVFVKSLIFSGSKCIVFNKYNIKSVCIVLIRYYNTIIIIVLLILY